MNKLIVAYHENGNKCEEGFYKNGRREGLWESWYENGEKELISYFKNGKPTIGIFGYIVNMNKEENV